MKVLLIDPPGSVPGINSGLGYIIAPILKELPEIVLQILDLNNASRNYKDLLSQTFSGNNFDVVGFSLKSHTYLKSIKIAHKIKKYFPRTLLIAGGPEVIILGEEFTKQSDIFDFCFTGESEYSFKDFLLYLLDKKNIAEIKGITYKTNVAYKSNTAAVNNNLNDLIFPDYSLLAEKTYLQQHYPLVTSRGCPYDCTYCVVNKVSGKGWRYRSPQNVVQELQQAKEKYAIKKFEVVDDNFTQNENRAKKICEELFENKINLKWSCPNGIRADRIDKELLSLMKKSNCEEIWYGVESLNEEAFNNINKGEKLKQIISAVKLTQEIGINVCGFFIIGLPYSTYKKDYQTLQKVKKLPFKKVTWSLATPIPKTKLWDWVKENGKFLGDYRKVSFFVEPKSVFETYDYSENERIKLYYKTNLQLLRYDCLLTEKNKIKSIIKFFWLVLKYDRKNIFKHFKVKLFNKFNTLFNYDKNSIN